MLADLLGLVHRHVLRCLALHLAITQQHKAIEFVFTDVTALDGDHVRYFLIVDILIR